MEKSPEQLQEELEDILRYIERKRPCFIPASYFLTMEEFFALKEIGNTLKMVRTAFAYGQAKGYRLAKEEERISNEYQQRTGSAGGAGLD